MFKEDLIVKRLINKKFSWELYESLTYNTKGVHVKIPKGFKFDFASVPLVLTPFFPQNGSKYDRASCLHDYLYTYKKFDRKKCDEVFLKAMLNEGVNKTKAYLFYFGVRIFGAKKYGVNDA